MLRYKANGVTNTGMEEIIAIVETNNRFSDGIQDGYRMQLWQ
jgi:formylmethanofuran dehydrogenase subunit E